MKLIDGVKIRKVAGHTVLVPVGKTTKTIKQSMLLNPEGAFFLERMQEETSIDALVAEGLKEYDAPEDVLRKDITALVNQLVEEGFIASDANE